MPLYEVKHRWTPRHDKTVTEKVGSVATLARKGQIPDGFRAISIVTLPNRLEAHCLWEAPSRDGLEAIYLSLGLPTQRTIRDVYPLLTAPEGP